MEALPDCVPYFMHASRCTVVKTGASPPYIYTYTPAPIAVPAKTMSITIRRGTEVFGYTGCIVSGLTFAVGDDGQLKFNVKIVGNDEASAAALGAITWPTTGPFGAGMYSLQIPTATQVFDSDSFEFSSDDNATPQYRLKSAGRGAQFVNFGESAATMKIMRDFSTRAEYDAFKALTSQTITLLATKGADVISINMPAAIKDAYEIAIGGQGDLTRASITYQGVIDGTGKHYLITVTCSENIV
jgi:hypothetical protein